MARQTAIAISHLTPRLEPYYLLSTLARIWEDEGRRVTVGRSYAADADICVLHHDLTKLDPTRTPSPPPRAPHLNGRVFDISKRSFSTLIITRDDPWRGPVIIKTNLNHYGDPENRARPDLAARVRKRLATFSWRGARMLPHNFYPVLNSKHEAPDWIWEQDDLIVEKFMPERTQGGFYSVRGWVFFGDKDYAYRLVSANPLVKREGATIEYLDGVPDSIRAARAAMKFDFGKFDYVEHDGAAILLDANKTPVYRGDPTSKRMQLLASGMEAFL